ncbi:hypothetical protein GCM10009631_19540 [Corynebacterium glaucum]
MAEGANDAFHVTGEDLQRVAGAVRGLVGHPEAAGIKGRDVEAMGRKRRDGIFEVEPPPESAVDKQDQWVTPIASLRNVEPGAAGVQHPVVEVALKLDDVRRVGRHLVGPFSIGKRPRP